jgi:eukaryotic-like serine/threonine-protein kinase
VHYSVEMARDPSTEMKVCRKCGANISAPLEFCSACLLETGLDLLTGLVDGENTNRVHLLGEFGEYELLEEIGRGGQGVVYRARQKSLNRIVALKVVAVGPWATEVHLKRFRREAEAAAALEHPRIVPIYEIGERDGCCYFSMQLVEGGQLEELVTGKRFDLRRAAEIIVKLARTVHYAHQRGILHRDIKPGNILIDREGEPYLTDFGLARLVEVESTITRTIEVLGTPSYMSPEQAAGEVQQLTTAADVYALGAVLYQLLTGSAPFTGGSIYETIRLVLESEPRRPSLVNRSVNRDLETICLKCLQKEPTRRYDSAKSLAEDLERFLGDEPIRSRRISRPERVWRWCKRKPVIAGLATALVLSALIGFAGVLWQLNRVQQEQAILHCELYTADMKLAYQAWQEGNLERAQALLRAHLPERGREDPSRAGDLRGFEWRYLWQLCQDESRFTFSNVNFTSRRSLGGEERRDLALAADGHTVISASGNTLRWLDAQSRHEMQTFSVGNTVASPVATAMSQPGLLAYYTDKVRCISPSGEKLLGGGVIHESCSAIALSPDGTLLASGDMGYPTTGKGLVRLWEVKTGAQISQNVPFRGAEGITTLTFSPDGKYLVCAMIDARIQVLEVPTLRVVHVLQGHTAWAISLAFDRTGKQLASSGNDSQIILWSFPEGREVTRLTGHRGSVTEVAFAPDGRALASGGRDHTVRVWNLGNPGAHTILHGHRGGVRSVFFSRDGKELYTGSYDGTVKVWQAPSAESSNVLRHHEAQRGLAFSPDGKLLATADTLGHTAWVWDLVSRRRWEQSIGQHPQPVQYVAFSPDGKFLVTAGLSDEVQVWDVSEHKMTFRFPRGPGLFSGIAFHPSEPILAIAADSVRFWNVWTGRETNLLVNPPAHGAQRVVFSPDGKRLALGMENGTISVWNLATGHEFHSFHENSSHLWQLCFSHDSTRLASAAENNRIVIYDVRRQRAIESIQAHTDKVWGLAFAPDDKTLISTSWDGTIKFWCVANQQLALTLAHEGGNIYSVAFSPDGNLMATCASDGTVRLWPAPSLAEIDAAEERARK